MNVARAELLALLKKRSFRLGNFKLSSSTKTGHYIDARMTTTTPEGILLIGDIIHEYTKGSIIHAIGGPEAGAIPIAMAATIHYYEHGEALNNFWVRRAIKGYGTQKLIEGNLEKDDRVIIVDDVASTGASILRCVEIVQEFGCEVVMTLAIVDRCEGAAEILPNFRPIFTIHDFGI